jgi:hypothetical protein
VNEGDPIREQAARFHGRLDAIQALMDDVVPEAREAVEAELVEVHSEFFNWVAFLSIVEPGSVPELVQRQEETR